MLNTKFEQTPLIVAAIACIGILRFLTIGTSPAPNICTCPECGGELVYRNGRFGKFISCINFPTCRYTENDEEELPEEAKEEKICPNCGAKMVIKRGRYGQFWACSNYPECKTIESLKKKAKPEPTGEMCPECGHELVRRKSRFGTTFIGCSNYPKCHYIKKEPKKTEEDK